MPLYIYGPISTISPIIPIIYGSFFSNISVTNYPQTNDVSGISITYGTKYQVCTFTSTSTNYTINYTATTNTGSANAAVCYVLAVGGGGGGGTYAGGGAGAGGVVMTPVILPIESSSISIKVGAGGTGATGLPSSYAPGSNGSNTTVIFNSTSASIGNIVAFGGGSGGYGKAPVVLGGSGGSGGGGYNGKPITSATNGYGVYNGAFNYGNKGFNIATYEGGGGGGGAGTAGIGYQGGDGIQCNLPGIKDFQPGAVKYGSYYWGGGGGGSGGSPSQYNYILNGGLGGGGGGSGASPFTVKGGGQALNTGGDGTSGNGPAGSGGANTGGGGGGAPNGNGGAGGSGIVIIAFPTTAITPAFSPINIPSGLLWLDAADSNTISTSGTAVTQWTDKSPAANHFTQSIAGKQPNTTTATINSLNAIDFTANSGASYMVDSSFNKPADYSAFMVGYTTSTAATTNFITDGSFAIQGAITTGYLNLVDTGTTTLTTTSAVNTNSLIGVTSDSYGYFQGYYDASYVGFKSASGIVPKTGMWLGSSNTATNYLKGYLGEVLFYSNALSTPNRQIIEGYLANRWGLASTLPTGHPFKLTVPSLTSLKNVFNPAQVGGADGCLLWLDAGDINSMFISSGKIAKWFDKSGKQNHFVQSTPSKQPTIASTNTINNLNTMNFTASTTISLSCSTINMPTDFTIYAVAYTTNSSGLGRFLNGKIGGDNATYFGFSSGKFYCIVGNGAGSWNTSAATTTSVYSTTTTNQAYLMGMLNANTTTGQDLYVNGTSVQTGNNGTTITYTGMEMCNTIQTCQAVMCEVLIYNSKLSLSQREKVEGYLAWKWGLQSNLPVGHTYNTTNYSYFPFVMPY